MLSNRTCAFSTGLFLFYYFQTVCYNKNMSDNKTLNKAKREKYNEYDIKIILKEKGILD